jgi:hypothetical protein
MDIPPQTGNAPNALSYNAVQPNLYDKKTTTTDFIKALHKCITCGLLVRNLRRLYGRRRPLMRGGSRGGAAKCFLPALDKLHQRNEAL